MKLTTDELELTIDALEQCNDIYYDEDTQALINKFRSKLNEINNQEDRLLSNSELKSIGL